MSAPSPARLRKYSVNIHGHATSYSLEGPFYDIIVAIAAARNLSIAALVAEVDAQRNPDNNLSSALRLHALAWVQQRVAE